MYRHAFAAKSRQAAFEYRLAMCLLNFGEGEEGGVHVRVLPLEKEAAEHAGASRQPLGTVDIVAEVLSSCGGVSVSLVLGMDTARDLLAGRWRRGEELLSLIYKLHVLHRPCSGSSSSSSSAAESELQELPLALRTNCLQTHKIIFHGGPVGDASSSAVRSYCPSLMELLAPPSLDSHPLVLQRLLHKKVLAYMYDRELYFYAQRRRLRLLAMSVVGAILAAILWKKYISNSVSI